MCRGIVGKEKVKFCCKEEELCGSDCHDDHKHDVLVDHFYIKCPGSAISMLCDPCLPVKALRKDETVISFLEITQPEDSWKEEFLARNIPLGTTRNKRSSTRTKATSSITREGLDELAKGPSMFTKDAIAAARGDSPADTSGTSSSPSTPEAVNYRPSIAGQLESEKVLTTGNMSSLFLDKPFDELTSFAPLAVHQ